jgi:hypothetical protein
VRSSSFGISRVLVRGGAGLDEAGSGAAHSLQNLESAGLSVSQRGHLVVTILSPVSSKNHNKPPGESQLQQEATEGRQTEFLLQGVVDAAVAVVEPSDEPAERPEEFLLRPVGEGPFEGSGQDSVPADLDHAGRIIVQVPFLPRPIVGDDKSQCCRKSNGEATLSWKRDYRREATRATRSSSFRAEATASSGRKESVPRNLKAFRARPRNFSRHWPPGIRLSCSKDKWGRFYFFAESFESPITPKIEPSPFFYHKRRS